MQCSNPLELDLFYTTLFATLSEDSGLRLYYEMRWGVCQKNVLGLRTEKLEWTQLLAQVQLQDTFCHKEDSIIFFTSIPLILSRHIWAILFNIDSNLYQE